MSKSNFNITDARPEDKQYVQQLAAKLSTLDKKAFIRDALAELVRKHQEDPSESNGGEVEKLTAKIQELTEQLKTVTADRDLTQKVGDEMIQNCQEEITELKKQLSEAQEQAGKAPTAPAYIFTPTNQQARNINRVVIYLIKRGKLTKQTTPEMLQAFTEKAINYFLKNEFSEVLK